MSFSSSCRKKNCGIIHSLANAKQKTLERRTPELKRHMLRYLRSRISVELDLWDQEIDEALWDLLCVCRNGERRDRERGMRRTGHYLHRWCYSPPFYLSKPLLYLHRSNPVGPNVLSVRVHKMSLTLSLRSSIYHSISSPLTIRGSKRSTHFLKSSENGSSFKKTQGYPNFLLKVFSNCFILETTWAHSLFLARTTKAALALLVTFVWPVNGL